MRSLRWLNLSSVWLLLLLQRAPALRQTIAGTTQLASSRVVSLLRAAFAATAGLGAVHSLAGATTLTTSQTSPASVTLQAAFGAAAAFALPAGSGDAAVLVRLPPGGYTVVVSGVGNTTGTALVEVYDLDP